MTRAAVAYLRTNEPSPERAAEQRVAIEAWASAARVEVACWHVDVGVGPETPVAERPALLAALASIRLHRAGVLVAANATRFAEDELVGWLVERAALVEGARLCTADGTRPKTRGEPSPDDVAYSRGALELARAYRRVTLGARVRAVLAEKKASGQRVGNLPYGFRLAADGVHLEPDPREQEIIEVVRSLSAEGLSQRAIVARLAERRIVGRTGAPLRQTQVAKILKLAS